MEQRLPFPVSVRLWDDLAERDRGFTWFDDDDLPLHSNHAAQIGVLDSGDACRVQEWAFAAIPPGWPECADRRFAHVADYNLVEVWGDAGREAEVRRWLYCRGVPFRRVVYLMYDRNRVVQTTWRMVVRYWDAFAYHVGYAMLAVDHTLGWACCFHHENVIVFGSHAPAGRAARTGGRPRWTF